MLSTLAFELLLGRVSQLLVGIEAGLDSRGPSVEIVLRWKCNIGIQVP
jgi:hypothetical protein